jgi:predicted nucleic acid-binding protein
VSRLLVDSSVWIDHLRGIDGRETRLLRRWLRRLDPLAVVEHYVALRKLGLTVRKAIDCLIAAWCIEHGVPLLHADRDFLPFVRHRGLVTA